MMDLLTTREMRSRIDDWSEDQEGPQCLESSRMCDISQEGSRDSDRASLESGYGNCISSQIPLQFLFAHEENHLHPKQRVDM